MVLALLMSLNWSYVSAYFSNNIGAPTTTSSPIAINIDDPPLAHLAVAGDVGTGGAEEYRTASAMDALEQSTPFDALLLLGDNVYDNGSPDAVGERVLQPFASVLDGRTQLLGVLGNHDIRDGNGPAQAAALGMPALWYSTVVGNVLVVALDSNQANNPEQLSWLMTTLAGDRPTWTVVIMHHSAYSAGRHGSDEAVQDNFVPLFEQHGIDLVLSGHDHDYQRSKPINGVTYVVTGAAAKLRPAGRADFTEVSWSTFSFVDLVAYDDRLVGQAIDHDGRAIDIFQLSI